MLTYFIPGGNGYTIRTNQTTATAFTMSLQDMLTQTNSTASIVSASYSPCESIASFTASIANAAYSTNSVTLAKGYTIYKITTSAASWVRVYTNVAARTTDATRSQTTDPQPGAGVIAEVITTGANVVVMSPATIGFNDESPVSNTIPIAVTNLSGSTGTITVTFTYLELEI